MIQSLHFYIGLDLGQRANHSAISVLDLALWTGAVRDPYHGTLPVTYTLRVRALERIALGTPYPDVMQKLRNRLNHHEVRGHATLIVDAGGPGLPFLDFLNTFPLNASLIKLLITGSGTPTHSNGLYHVSRAQLLTNLVLLVEQNALKVAAGLPEAPTLIEELHGLRADFSTRAEQDDLTMATALAAWQATKGLFRQDLLKYSNC